MKVEAVTPVLTRAELQRENSAKNPSQQVRVLYPLKPQMDQFRVRILPLKDLPILSDLSALRIGVKEVVVVDLLCSDGPEKRQVAFNLSRIVDERGDLFSTVGR